MRPLLRALAVLFCIAPAAMAQEEPPRRLDFGTDSVERQAPRDTATVTSRELRTAFVRSQTILGLTVYGPAFSAMVADDAVTATAAYFVLAGGSFFAANEIARRAVITPSRQFLSSRMAWRGTLNGLELASVLDLDRRPAAALTLLGGVGGTATGLVLGRGRTEGEAVSMVVGHDVAYVSALLIGYIIDPTDYDGRGISRQTRRLASTALGWVGYALGNRYAATAFYEVTPGDAMLLWVGASLGTTTVWAIIAEAEPSRQAVAATILVGGLGGIWAADRWLVRQYDHTTADGTLVSLGSLAGGLMGIGVGVLIAGEAERGASLTLALASLGGLGGVILTERYVAPRRDEGRQYLLGRVEFNPLGAAAVAARAPGAHSIVRFTF
ncbi:MAG: hypothetical protein WD771_10375 [Gemmatimonadaceae bacterium]